MPESHEKRQRNRRKQQKRKEKLEKRLNRKSVKRDGDPSPLYHNMRRGDEQYRVATDLWLSVLDLAAVGGWVPPESEDPELPASAAYAHPDGLKMTTEDAALLARSIEALLPGISEDELPFSNSPFGPDHTEELLARRAEGEKLPLEEAATAQELLSGPPKMEVERLAVFLRGGAVFIEAD